MRKPVLIFLCITLLSVKPALSRKKTEIMVKDTSVQVRIPKAEKSVTHHSIVINNRTIKYTGTVGTLIIRDDADSAIAGMNYFTYTLDDVKDPSSRPVAFAYNGGPGSSSIWLHMGALGPKRIETANAGYTQPPPYKTVDNEYSIIDKTDLVMIDPVGTGFSKALGKKKDKDFWGVDQYISSMSRFIIQYVTENNRWNSPKFLIGESYGTTRSAGIVDYLQTNENMAFNGAVLVSLALDIGAIFEIPGNERPYPLFLPSYTAVSWYHHVLPNQPEELEPLLQKVKQFALGDYNNALMKGNNLADSDKNTIAEKLHEYTGLSISYIKKSNLRIEESKYTQELMRENNLVVGRIDARFLGSSFDPLSEMAEYDPQYPAVAPAFTAAFLDYVHRDLKFGVGKEYNVSGDKVYSNWDWKHKAPSKGEGQWLVNTGADLAHAMIYNPDLKVIVLQGIYDLATPVLATEYMVSHLNMEKEFQSHIAIKYYEAGHMMYLHIPDLKKMKEDMSEFIDATLKK
jgi:carboxypeptidase C (cathepsin A)